MHRFRNSPNRMTDLCLQIIELIKCIKLAGIFPVTNHVENNAECGIKHRLSSRDNGNSPTKTDILLGSIDVVFCILDGVSAYIWSR